MSEPEAPRGTDYVEIPGDIVLRQPIALTGATMYGWLLDADYARLQALCDRVFNSRPSGFQYRPLIPAVALVCANMARGQSTDPVDHAKGGMSERDLGFWMPVVRGRQKGDLFEIDQLAWYHPYLFIDNEAAFVVGRETYGFRKYIGTCTMPASTHDVSTFAVDTLYIEHFAPDAWGQVGRLWTLAADGERGDLTVTYRSLEHLVEAAAVGLRERFATRTEELPVPTWQLLENLVRDLVHGLVPMAFLRQLRDVAHANLAAYQAIVEAPCKLTSFRGAGLVRPHTLAIKTVDSHPIVDQLGLRNGTTTGGVTSIEAGVGWWLGIDFVMADGTTLWQSR